MEGPRGYDFQPKYTEEELMVRRRARAAAAAAAPPVQPPPGPDPVPAPNRMGNNDWCECGSCVPMPSVIQCRCCHEVDNCDRFLDARITCIVRHEDFQKVCMERVVLRTALVARLDSRGHRRNLPEVLDNISYRYAAYRLFTYWVHGYLGKGVRRVIPACAVTRIREAFPEPDGNYIGFKEGDDGDDIPVPEEFLI
ncbi:P2X purinoceptor 7-like [Lytechinus pictus]|uniref:P2X purinoceptor 7-like n=1 Tax=Lytechinus pictus TaxID=7653 RepID=UPI0030B9F84B